MLITRRRWLSIATAGTCSAFAPPAGRAAGDDQADLERRVSRVVEEYSQQGFHRTGTAVDRRSADWLYEEVRRAGLAPAREPFTLSRIRSRRSEHHRGKTADSRGCPSSTAPSPAPAGSAVASVPPAATPRLALPRARRTAPRQGRSATPAASSGTRRSSSSRAAAGRASARATPIRFSHRSARRLCRCRAKNRRS